MPTGNLSRPGSGYGHLVLREPFFIMRMFLLPHDTIMIIATISALVYCSSPYDGC